MSKLEYHFSNKFRVCKLCEGDIVPHTYALVMRDVHVSPSYRDLHFHEGCFFRALEHAKENHPNKK